VGDLVKLREGGGGGGRGEYVGWIGIKGESRLVGLG